MSFILSVLAVLLVVEGVPYFAFPRKAKAWALMVGTVPDRVLRIMGLISMAGGIIMLYAIRFF
ncbi:MAG: DUF2065 domain-containing protein [Deltaproteobacteria bacterium]|nr:DUF2065 domain-containing protein [Deltaproteobacteria bacterium]